MNESKAEEEVDLEYLRNVILQFSEHKEMRVSYFLPRWRKSHMLMPRVFLLIAESCENPDHQSEIHPAGDSAVQPQPMSSPLSLQYIDVFVLCAAFYVSRLIVLSAISTTERDHQQSLCRATGRGGVFGWACRRLWSLRAKRTSRSPFSEQSRMMSSIFCNCSIKISHDLPGKREPGAKRDHMLV